MTKRIKVSDEMLIEAVRESTSIRGVLRKLNLREAGGSASHYSVRIKELGISMAHFTGKSYRAGKTLTKKRNASNILIYRESGSRQKHTYLLRALLEIGREHKCEKCNQPPEWMGHQMTLDIDHINENWLDDRAENLRFLCPNCHSQFSRNLITNNSLV